MASLGLQTLFLVDPENNKSDAIDVDIVLISGIGTSAAQSWASRDDWKSRVLHGSEHIRAHINTYIYEVRLDEQFSWRRVLDKGIDLLGCLFKARAATKERARPIIFICHSLGGVILKQASMLTLNSGALPRSPAAGAFEPLIKDIAGIVFLGTPHAASTDEKTWSKCVTILQTFGKLGARSKQTLSHADERFKISDLALVDRPFATIGASMETVTEVAVDHASLTNLTSADSRQGGVCVSLQSIFKTLSSDKKLSSDSRETQATHITKQPIMIAPANLIRHHELMRNPDLETSGNAFKAPREQLADRTNTITTTRHLQARLPCFSVPQHTKNPGFFARADVFEQIDKHLLPVKEDQRTFEAAPRHFALCGMGGIGKTELAVEYVYTRREFFDAILWVEAGQVLQLASGFARLSRDLGLEESTAAQDLITSREISKSWMSATTHGQDGSSSASYSWLLVFNNADDPDILADYWPSRGNGSVLLTSRDPSAKIHSSFKGHGIDIQPLTEDEAIKFIISMADCEDDEQPDALELSHLLGGLPLALVQMAGIMNKQQLSLRELVAELRKGDTIYTELHQLNNAVQELRYGATLATAWQFHDLSPDAKDVLKIVSMLNPDGIQEHILESTEEVTDTGTKLSEAFPKARAELLRSSLITRAKSSKEIRIHRVIQSEVRASMEHTDVHVTFQKVARLLSTVWPFAELDKWHVVSRWAMCEKVFPHLQTAYEFYKDQRTRLNLTPTMTVAKLFNGGGSYLHERGFSQLGKPYLELALEYCESRAPESEIQPLLSDLHFTLSAAANETNYGPACYKHSVALLGMRETIFHESRKVDKRLAAAHNQMGIANMMQRKYALATDHFKQSINLFEELDDFEVDMLAFPMANLGWSLWVQGQLDDAEAILSIALARREESFGKMDRLSYKTGRILHGLGNVKASKGERAKAEGDASASDALLEES